MNNDKLNAWGPLRAFSKANYKVEFFAALSTYMTMSYIFLLNPSLLISAGVNPSAAFFATVITAFFATMAMGIYANLPYAVAPVPTVTTFFVFYVCQKMHFSFQEALAAVLVSGLLSVAATMLSYREKLIKAMPDSLKISIMFAIGGFLIANGLKISQILPYDENGLVFSSLSLSRLSTPSAAVAFVGFGSAVLLNSRYVSFKGGTLFALLISIAVAVYQGFDFKRPVFEFTDSLSSFGVVDLGIAVDTKRAASFWFAAFVFFVVDFYGSIGKFVGLFEMTKRKLGDSNASTDPIYRALYVDSWATVGGALLGTSSAAVFISSAVGVMVGGRTGLTAVFCALLMLISIVVLPFVGAVPTIVNAGILMYIGALLMPWDRLSLLFHERYGIVKCAVCFLSCFVAILTFGIDKALFAAFALSCVILVVEKGLERSGAFANLVLTTILLGTAAFAQAYFQ